MFTFDVVPINKWFGLTSRVRHLAVISHSNRSISCNCLWENGFGSGSPSACCWWPFWHKTSVWQTDRLTLYQFAASRQPITCRWRCGSGATGLWEVTQSALRVRPGSGAGTHPSTVFLPLRQLKHWQPLIASARLEDKLYPVVGW